MIEEPGKVSPEDTQHTRFKPLKLGVEFSFRVYFENLSDRELGALCWTLHPHGETERLYYHHLGMGKPLGMGAVELHARLHLIDRSLRYKKLFNDSNENWQLGESVVNAAGEDLAVPGVLARLTRPFEKHLLHELNPQPACGRLADMRRIAMLLKLLEWPGYRAEEGDRYLANKARPNTRYMILEEYKGRPVLPDPTQFEHSYFRNKSRPQASQTDQVAVNQRYQPPILEQQHIMHEVILQAVTVEHPPKEEDISQPAISSELAELFPAGRELRNLVDFTQNEQGVEVRFWDLDPTQIIGFIPLELVDRQLGQKISVIVTGLHQEVTGRLVVELKLRPRR